MTSSTIVDVYSAANGCDAYFVKSMLEDTGIDAHVVGDLLNIAGGGLPLGLVIAPRIWVAQENALRARRLIEEWESTPLIRVESDASVWKCAGCGEAIDDTLELCWQCGTARDGTKDLVFDAQRPSEPPDEPIAGRRIFNSRAVGLSVLLLAVALAACGFLGASVLLLFGYGIFSGIFSAVVGWIMNLVMPVPDEWTSEP